MFGKTVGEGGGHFISFILSGCIFLSRCETLVGRAQLTIRFGTVAA